MYSTKVLGNSTGTLNVQRSSYKAALRQAIKQKRTLPHGPKKK